jgi:cell division protein ZipA
MTNELRLILLAAGILVLAAIYFAGRAAERDGRRRDTVRDAVVPARQWPDGGPLDELPDFADLEFLAAEQVPAADTAAADSVTDIVALHVLSDGEPFRGADILAAARAAGLIYGAMNIFHCYTDDSVRGRERVFSVANAHEPGSFDLEHIEQVTTAGVSLFLCRPAPTGDAAAFDRMYQAARLFAERLSGTVCGADHRPLHAEQLAALRRALAG